MNTRLLLALLASALSVSAQTTAFGTKVTEAAPAATTAASPAAPTAGTPAASAPAATTPAPAAKPKSADDDVDNSVVITPFRALTPPDAKTTRTFQLSKMNKLGFTETTKELQRLYSAFATQRIVDGSPNGSSKATGYLTSVNYSLIQDLGDNRFLAKAAWPAAGPNEVLAAGVDTMAILLLDHPIKVGEIGHCTGMHVGTVSLLFTASFPPLTGKRLTLRREAFVECNTLEESPAGLQKFVDKIMHGAEVSVTTNEMITCKKCGGLGFTSEKVKGSLTEKHINCSACDGAKSVALPTETKIIP